MDTQECDGYGREPHPAHGLVDVLQPIPMQLCGRCWRTWITAKHGWKGTDRGESRTKEKGQEEGTS